MKKLALLALLLATPAHAQLTANSLGQVQMPPQTVLGNSQPVTGALNAIPFSQLAANLFLATSGTSCPTGLAAYQPFANTTGAPTATSLTIWDTSQCVPWATLNQNTHVISGAFGGTLTSGSNGNTAGSLTLNGLTSGASTLGVNSVGGGLTVSGGAGTLGVNGGISSGAASFANGQLTLNGTTSGSVIASTPATGGQLNINGTLQSGVNGGTGGQLTLNGSTSGSAIIGVSSTGTPQYGGTATNDNAPAGDIGEYVSSTVASGSAVSLSNGIAANLTSLSLTAGDWDMVCEPIFGGAGTTTVSTLAASVNTTSATMTNTPGQFVQVPGFSQTVFASSGLYTLPVPPVRVSTNATVTVFCVVQESFAVSTANVYGFARARRVR